MKANSLSVYATNRRSRSIARGDAPGKTSISIKLFRIAHRILLLRIDRTTAVLEVVDRLPAHVVVLNAAKVDPEVREVMDKQRPGVEKLTPVNSFPLIRPGPGAITLLRKRVSPRGQAEHIKNQGFAVTGPAIPDESPSRSPAMRNCQRFVLCPVPVGAVIKRVGETAQFALVFRIAVEVFRCRERTRN